MDESLFDSDYLHKLEGLALVARKLHRGALHGERKSYKKGSSLEFIDYRGYQPGDDMRYIDWNIYARLGRLFVKLFAAEEDLTVHILIDTSASMGVGRPPKIDYAKRIAAALGYIGIVNLDRVGVTAFSDSLRDALPAVRRRSHVSSLFDYCSRIATSGLTHINTALMEYALSADRPGLAIVVSDLLDPAGYQAGLMSLLYRRFEVILIHVLDETEVNPKLDGLVRLVDSETDEEVTVDVDGSALASYRKRLSEFFSRAEQFAASRGIEYIRTSTRVPFEELVMRYLRQGSFLK